MNGKDLVFRVCLVKSPWKEEGICVFWPEEGEARRVRI